MFGHLTRFPGDSMPAEAATGNTILDGFLVELDGHLYGSARVRLLFLVEIREHLMEKYDHLVATGCSEVAAMENAVQSMGAPVELAKSQRKALKTKFLRIGLCFGIVTCLFQGLFGSFNQFLSDKGPAFIVLYSLSHGVLGGLFFGWFVAFIWPERRLSSILNAGGGSETENEFVVHYGRLLQLLSYIIAVFFILGGIGAIFWGIAGSDNPSFNRFSPYPWWINVIIGAMSILCFFFAKMGTRKYKVKEDGVYVEEFLGLNKVFTWKTLKKVGLLGDRWSWAPFYWKKVKYAEFENGKLKTTSMFVYPDMINADRLFVLLDKKAHN